MGKLRYVLLVCLAFVLGISVVHAEHLVLLTTNDTHSHIDPDFDGLGGVLRRKVLFDSVRVAEKNVMRVDAGDVVQGSLYFSEYGGEVEFPLMDMLGYDIMIMGNHELDNGIARLAPHYKKLQAVRLSSNYDFSGTALEGVHVSYVIREFDGKKIAFIGLSLQPDGMIDATNSVGLKFKDIITTANELAHELKCDKGADFVVAVTHIGYDMASEGLPGDVELVNKSTDIDLVIGGHTHTLINPTKGKVAWLVANKEGRMIPVTQTGCHGKAVGLIDIDLDTFKVDYRVLPVDKRYDSRINYPDMEAFIAPYKHVVDSMMNREVAVAAKEMKRGLGALSNWVSDAAFSIASDLSDLNPQCAVMNKGGIRCDMPKGSVSEGLVNTMFPFDNRLVVLELTGEQLLRGLEVMAMRGGDATSKELIVTFGQDRKIVSAAISGEKINPKKKYRVVTLDYLANGGDYMTSFKDGKVLFKDSVKVAVRYLEYIKNLTEQGLQIDATDKLRMKMIEK